MSEYKYDVQGVRVRKSVERTIDGQQRKVELMVHSKYFVTEKQTLLDGSGLPGTKTAVNNVYLNGVRIASLNSNGLTKYYHANNVDSVKVVTDEAGAAISRTEYLPYGETFAREGDLTFAPKYNGQALDQESDLYFFNARHYDPEIARFVTADTVTDGPMTVKGWNRYMYVGGNPIMYKDPTGHAVTPGEKITARGGDPSDRSKYTPIMVTGKDGNEYLTYSNSKNDLRWVDDKECSCNKLKANLGGSRGWVNARNANPKEERNAPPSSSPGKRPSDNRTSSEKLDDFQDALSYGGEVPVIGEVFDVVNGLGYLARGRFSDAGWAFASIVPFVGPARKSFKAGKKIYNIGKAGEKASGVIKNTKRIPSLSGTARYRIPDGLDDAVLAEVKNVKNLSYTKQLRDFNMYSQKKGLSFDLFIRPSTRLSGPLKNEILSGNIDLRYLPK